MGKNVTKCLPEGPYLRSLNYVKFSGKYTYQECNIYDCPKIDVCIEHDVYYNNYCLRYSIFCDVMKRRLLVNHRRFVAT